MSTKKGAKARRERIAVCKFMADGECLDADAEGGNCTRIKQCPYTGKFVPLTYAIVETQSGWSEVIEWEVQHGH